MKEANVSSNQRAFTIEALAQNLRLNGRRLDEGRKPKIIISHDEPGFVEIEWGKTKVSIRVSAEISRPYDDRPFEGLFSINCETSSMASLSFENGRSSDEEILITRLIEKAIRRSNALDLESLCIVAGEKVWHVRVDINFLNHDGGLVDASCLGVMTALRHFMKPEISIRGTEVIVHSVRTHQPTPLSILHVPLCVTYSFFNPTGKAENIKGDQTNEICVIDADKEEECFRDGYLVLTMNMNRELIQISKTGGLPIDGSLLVRFANRSLSTVESLTDQMNMCLKENLEKQYRDEKLDLLQVVANR